ncbi:MAG: alpha/beta fold hydrolase [Tagaea sp.]
MDADHPRRGRDGDELSFDPLPGFVRARLPGAGAEIAFAHAGEGGKPLLLLHGHPQTHVTWHKIARVLVEAGYRVVLPDLRGYGDSSKPPGGERHVAYSKREMAKDMVALMAQLGHRRFSVVGHDRGGRVAHRMALDHPDIVAKIAVLDIAPTATMYRLTDMEFAKRYFWWFFLIQPAPLPEKLIGADPEFFLRTHLAGQMKVPGAADPRIVSEYLRCYRNPDTIHAICEDYRAAATIDLEHDAESERAGKKVEAPLLALWGAMGTVGALYDVLATWRAVANDVQGRALSCGHTLQEELPEETVAALTAFLAN